jgi:hypothetical protein
MPKISDLSAITSVTNDDLMIVINDPNGSPTTNRISVNNFFSSIPATTKFTGNVIFGKSISLSNTSISNVTLTFTMNNTANGGGYGTNKLTYKTIGTKLDVNTSIQYLAPNTSSDGSDSQYYLPDGANGQIMYFVAKTSQHIGDISIWVNKLRSYNEPALTSNSVWTPFHGTYTPRTMAMACYIDGAWNIDNNVWDT